MQRAFGLVLRVGVPVAAVLVSIGIVAAGAQAPAGAPAPAAPGAQAPGGGFGGGRGGGRGIEPTALRSIPAETVTAKAKNPNWKAPRTSWGDPDISGQFSTDDMNSVPVSRGGRGGRGAPNPQPAAPAAPASESITAEEFQARARGDEQQKYSAVNLDTFLRNERGTRTFGWAAMVIDPPTGVMPPMVAEYRKMRAAKSDQGTFGNGPFDTFDDFTLYERCITRGILGSTLPVIYGNGIRIMQSPTEVAITYEMIHDTRVIPITTRPLPAANIKQYMGASRGRWEGDTLVVETRNLTDKTSIGANGNGSRHSDQMKLTEWFTRVDPDMVEYKVRVEDPVAYTAPFTLRMMFTTQPDYEVLEYSCLEGNGAVQFALSAERAYDRSVAEAKAKGLPIPVRDMSSPYGPPAGGLEIRDVNTGERTTTPAGRGGGFGGGGGRGGGAPAGRGGAPQ
jgi:hypothetical protein